MTGERGTEDWGPLAADFENVLYQVRDRVALITLNRPEALNALSHGEGGMHEEISAAMSLAEEDDAVHVVVLTGAGRAFCSGGDMKKGDGIAKTSRGWLRFLEAEDRDNLQIRNLAKPVIAAINGGCYGAGMVMAGHCDIVLAAESAKFGLIESRMGATGIGVFPFIVGAQWAKFLMISGELLTARKAKEIGLVLEVIEDERLMEKALDLARRVAAMPRDAVELHKQEVNGTFDIAGYAANKVFTRTSEAVINTMAPASRALDGRLLWEILRDEGFKAFREARDGPFREPWIED